MTEYKMEEKEALEDMISVSKVKKAIKIVNKSN